MTGHGQLEKFGVIENWDSVCAFFRKIPKAGGIESEGSDGWEEDWNWNEENEKEDSEDGLSSGDEIKNDITKGLCLRDYVVASSPMGDTFMIAQQLKVSFMTGLWDKRNEHMTFQKSFQGTLSHEGEIVSSAACIPLISKKKSSPGSPDWTCIAIGFNTGYLRFYTEQGELLVSQIFHDEPVKGIKCRSFQAAVVVSEHDQLEELLLVYKSVFVTIDGFSLFQTLRACRNHLARMHANALPQSGLETPPLSYKKWGYEKVKSVNDCDSVGLRTPCYFDHLLSGSVIGGINAQCKPMPFTSNVFLNVATKPFMTYNIAQEGHASPILTEIAYAVASRLKSSILSAASGWLGFGSSSKKTQAAEEDPDKKQVRIEPATPMAARFGIMDQGRTGLTISSSPCRKLSVMTDSLARVVLFDNNLGLAVRMWKGYRDAQCAWIRVQDEVIKARKGHRDREHPREALFLAIYAPRKGYIDVFAMQQGPKVASFQTSKNGILLSSFFGMMGLNNIPIIGGNKPTVQCLFADECGILHSINIPFHLAISDSKNFRIKDVYLLRTLQKILRGGDYNNQTIMEVLNDLKTQGMINQAFKLLSQKCDKTDVLEAVIETYLQNFCDDDSKDLCIVFYLQSLLGFYNKLVISGKTPPPYNTSGEIPSTSSVPSNEKSVLKCFRATDEEIQLIHDLANKELFNRDCSKKVSFQSQSEFVPFSGFVGCVEIDFNFDPVNKKCNRNDPFVGLNWRDPNIDLFGNLIFCGCFNNQSSLDDWTTHIENSRFKAKQMLQLVFEFWNRNALSSSSYVAMMERLYQVIRQLLLLAKVDIQNNAACAWWEEVQNEIRKAHSLFFSYSFSFVCRAASIDLMQELGGKGETGKRNKKSDDDDKEGIDDLEDWEEVSLDLIKWNVLLKQIEDLSLLSTVLKQKIVLKNPNLPMLSFDSDVEYSIAFMLDKGKGCVGELVGRWLTSIGLDPDKINAALEEKNQEELENVSSNDELEDTCPTVLNVTQSLACLVDNFPLSLSTSVIISNYCWEYFLEWNKVPDESKYFDAAFKCVKQIRCQNMKQGIMQMIWTTFLSDKLEKFASLYEESVPIFKFQESKEHFLHIVVDFLDHWYDVVEGSTSELVAGSAQIRPKVRNSLPKPSKKNPWGMDSGAKSLTDLSLLQPKACCELILLHYQLALVTYFYYTYQIRKKIFKPFNLFDTKSKMAFFTGMKNEGQQGLQADIDLALKNSREQFLCVVISNIVNKIPEEEDEGHDHTLVPSYKEFQESNQWIQRCIDIGRIWSMDLDGIRINLVYEYYSCGFDYLGLENLGIVAASDVLGSKLLVIAGMRINYLIQQQQNDSRYTEIIANMSPNVYNWLTSLNYTQLKCLRFSKKSIVQMMQEVLRLIPKSNYDFKLAEEVLLVANVL